MPHRATVRDRAISGLVVFLAEAAVVIAAIVLALLIGWFAAMVA
jgi:hypothetical protein